MSVSSGEAGVHELRIETSETNTGRDLHRLGQLTVALDDGSANRTVDLQQRPQAARQTLLMYFCGTDLYSYYKNNLSDVAKALSRNILPLGRIVAFTQPAAGEGYVVEYRHDEAASACERDTLIRYTPLPGRTTDPAVMERILGDMAAAPPPPPLPDGTGSRTHRPINNTTPKISCQCRISPDRRSLWDQAPIRLHEPVRSRRNRPPPLQTDTDSPIA